MFTADQKEVRVLLPATMKEEFDRKVEGSEIDMTEAGECLTDEGDDWDCFTEDGDYFVLEPRAMMMMEYCPHGDLFDVIEKSKGIKDTALLKTLFIQMC